MALRVLASGVDTLQLSARGGVRAELWDALEAAKRQAQAEEAAAPFDFPAAVRASLVKPYGLRGYTYWTYWLASPDCELLLGWSERFPAALVQLHSAGLHSLGVERAVDLVEGLLRVEVFASVPELVVSRVDVYTDAIGWDLELADLDRFVCRGRSRRGFVERELTFASGRRLTGFMFGRDALVARLYDKTAEIALRGVTWLHDLWGERDGGRRSGGWSSSTGGKPWSSSGCGPSMRCSPASRTSGATARTSGCRCGRRATTDGRIAGRWTRRGARWRRSRWHPRAVASFGGGSRGGRGADRRVSRAT
jgi:hypothetical protein